MEWREISSENIRSLYKNRKVIIQSLAYFVLTKKKKFEIYFQKFSVKN